MSFIGLFPGSLVAGVLSPLTKTEPHKTRKPFAAAWTNLVGIKFYGALSQCDRTPVVAQKRFNVNHDRMPHLFLRTASHVLTDLDLAGRASARGPTTDHLAARFYAFGKKRLRMADQRNAGAH
jgi:hypothetical protein